MSDQQLTGDTSSSRSNPNRQWVCGYVELGLCCKSGPTDSGRCGKALIDSTICPQPTVETGAVNSATQTYNSDPFDIDLLPPCLPRRSVRFSRRLWSLNAGILIGACLLFFMVIPVRESVFVPGELSRKHAQILQNTVVSERCSLCHPTSHSDMVSKSDIVNQDTLCLRCHASHMLDAGLRSPHDLPQERVVSLSRQVHDRLVASGKLVVPNSTVEHWIDKGTSCSVCHSEHHGRAFDLKKMSHERCQACHQQQFASLSNGHPEFENFPKQRHRRFAFDHRAHEAKHFPQKNQTFDCRVCHFDRSRDGVAGPIFRTLGFDVACAQCHNEPIRAAIAQGWPVIQLPSLEEADTQDPALGVTDWPLNARFGYDCLVSPILRTMLQADDAFQELLSMVPESGKLTDVPAFERIRAKVARGLAQSTRRLIEETAQFGQSAWQQRLRHVMAQRLGRELSSNELRLISDACAGLPPDLMRQIQNTWFKNSVSLASAPTKSPHQSTSGNDSLQNDIQPSDADSLLGLGDDARKSESTKLPKLRGPTHVADGGWYLDQETLTANYMPRGHADPLLTAWIQILLLLNDSQALNTSGDPSAVQPGRADVFLKQVPGKCTECHILHGELGSTTSEPSLWHSHSKPVDVKTFTKFDHRPHLTLPVLGDCRFCHQLAPEANRHKLVSSLGASTSENDHRHDSSLASEFVSLKSAQCSACHRPGGANDGCTQCHNYHVGTL